MNNNTTGIKMNKSRINIDMNKMKMTQPEIILKNL